MQTPKIAASLIALATLAAGSAFAADAQTFSEAGSPFPVTASTRTRAEVQAEYLAAQTASALPKFSEASVGMPATAGSKTSAAVRTEYDAARAAGTLPAFSEQ